jgi:hypothetical protein
MAKLSKREGSPGQTDGDATSGVQPKTQALVDIYLLEHLPIYRELHELRGLASTNQLIHIPGFPSASHQLMSN